MKLRNPACFLLPLLLFYLGVSAGCSTGKAKFIDEACIISPRPKMAEVSSLISYDYEKRGQVHVFMGDLDPEGAADKAVVVGTGVAGESVALHQHRYRVELSWTTSAMNAEAIMVVLSRQFLGGWSRVGGPWKLKMTDKPSTLPTTNLPHVFSSPIRNGGQDVHVKTDFTTDKYWVSLVFERH